MSWSAPTAPTHHLDESAATKSTAAVAARADGPLLVGNHRRLRRARPLGLISVLPTRNEPRVQGVSEAAGRDWASVFSEEFAAPESAVQARVWAEVLGAEYPAELAPYSYTTRSELARFAAEVRVGPGELLVDVGSGRGGPGLWVAATTGAGYVAVDIAVEGLAEVKRRAARLGLGDRVDALEGSFESLPLPTGVRTR